MTQKETQYNIKLPTEPDNDGKSALFPRSLSECKIWHLNVNFHDAQTQFPLLNIILNYYFYRSKHLKVDGYGISRYKLKFGIPQHFTE